MNNKDGTLNKLVDSDDNLSLVSKAFGFYVNQYTFALYIGQICSLCKR